MNIFALHQNPILAAQYHCDQHVVKMVLETAQLLSGVWHLSDSCNPPGIYKPTHQNHPCAVWARASQTNYLWLWVFGMALAEEYHFRYDREHKSQAVIERLHDWPDQVTSLELTPFALAMPEWCHPKVHTIESHVEAYRRYYLAEKMYLSGRSTWTRRDLPPFIKSECVN